MFDYLGVVSIATIRKYGYYTVSGWWFGTWMWLSHILGISWAQLTDFHIFQRGKYTTNQLLICWFIRSLVNWKWSWMVMNHHVGYPLVTVDTVKTRWPAVLTSRWVERSLFHQGRFSCFVESLCPLVVLHSCGKSPCLMGKSTINGDIP